MADFLSQANVFRINVLEGENEGETIELAGRALPYRGIPFGTEQRSKTTYYGGNPVASQQVFGPTEQDTVINGIWKDIFLGNGVAKKLVRTFEDLVRGGVQVQVVWGESILPSGEIPEGTSAITRTGIVKRIVPKYDRPQDVAWEITFEWRGRDEPAQPPLLAAGSVNEREGFLQAASEFENLVGEIQAFVEAPLNRITGFSQEFQAEADRIQNAVANAAIVMNQVTDALGTQDSLTSDLIERARGALDNGAAALRDLNDAVQTIPSQLVGGTAIDSALAYLSTMFSLFAISRSSDAAQTRARQADDSLGAKMLPDAIAEVRPVAGTDLRDLARQYYGDADLWWQIAAFNGLSSSRVPDLPAGPSDDPARPIRIPRRTDGAPGDLRAAC